MRENAVGIGQRDGEHEMREEEESDHGVVGTSLYGETKESIESRGRPRGPNFHLGYSIEKRIKYLDSKLRLHHKDVGFYSPEALAYRSRTS